MLFYLAPILGSQSFLGVSLKKATYEVFGCLAHIFRELEFALLDVFIEGWNIIGKVGRLSD